MTNPPAMPVAQKVRIVLPLLAAQVLARLPAALGYRNEVVTISIDAPPLKRLGPRRRRSFPRPPRSCLLARHGRAQARARFRFTGARGYLKDAGIERDLRDAVVGTICSGTSEIQRVVLVRMLGTRATGLARHHWRGHPGKEVRWRTCCSGC